MSKTIDIIVPIYNEEAVLDELVARLKKMAGAEGAYQFRLLMVENGSRDGSHKILEKHHRTDERIKIIRLSRNFGCDNAITAGLRYATGDAAVIMNADLQDPPEVIPDFLRKWEQDYAIVYGIIRTRSGEGVFKRILSSSFYVCINLLTKGLFPRNASDFRLIDRKVISAVNQFKETNRYMRGLVVWTGFNQTGVEFDRPPRFAGNSKSGFRTIFSVAMNGIFSFSYFPLRLTTCVGIVMSSISFLLMVSFLSMFFMYGRLVPGHTSTIVTMLFLFGILFFVLGIIGEYLARIYDEVKGRPNYIVAETTGLE